MIRAIETHYNGYRFRSRLEARWAVFFDALGIEYEYEPQGFEAQGYAEDGLWHVHKYLPDFYLPKTKTWVEVKGVMSEHNTRTLNGILNSHFSPMPGISNSDNCYVDRVQCPGLLILGDIPNIQWGVVYHPIITHHTHDEELKRRHITFVPNEKTIHRADDGEMLLLLRVKGDISNLDAYTGGGSSLFDPGHIALETKLADKKLMEAYKAARSARFEFGETPKVYKVAT